MSGAGGVHLYIYPPCCLPVNAPGMPLHPSAVVPLLAVLPFADASQDYQTFRLPGFLGLVSGRSGRVNMHWQSSDTLDPQSGASGEWLADPDGYSQFSTGSSVDTAPRDEVLAYCQKFYPGTPFVDPSWVTTTGYAGSTTWTNQAGHGWCIPSTIPVNIDCEYSTSQSFLITQPAFICRQHTWPSPSDMWCTDSCMGGNANWWASNGACTDGGPGAEGIQCHFGTDCSDCGPRMGNAPPGGPSYFMPPPPSPLPPTPPSLPPPLPPNEFNLFFMFYGAYVYPGILLLVSIPLLCCIVRRARRRQAALMGNAPEMQMGIADGQMFRRVVQPVATPVAMPSAFGRTAQPLVIQPAVQAGAVPVVQAVTVQAVPVGVDDDWKKVGGGMPRY